MLNIGKHPNCGGEIHRVRTVGKSGKIFFIRKMSRAKNVTEHVPKAGNLADSKKIRFDLIRSAKLWKMVFQICDGVF